MDVWPTFRSELQVWEVQVPQKIELGWLSYTARPPLPVWRVWHWISAASLEGPSFSFGCDASQRLHPVLRSKVQGSYHRPIS